MIARYWSATATSPDAYRQHFRNVVVPNLESLDGFQGCYLLEQAVWGGGTCFVALTLWESEDSIRAFAGEDISRSHVEPEGQAALSSFDPDALHFTVTVQCTAATGVPRGE